MRLSTMNDDSAHVRKREYPEYVAGIESYWATMGVWLKIWQVSA